MNTVEDAMRIAREIDALDRKRSELLKAYLTMREGLTLEQQAEIMRLMRKEGLFEKKEALQ